MFTGIAADQPFDTNEDASPGRQASNASLTAAYTPVVISPGS